jgi:hypothetical protein
MGWKARVKIMAPVGNCSLHHHTQNGCEAHQAVSNSMGISIYFFAGKVHRM